MWGLQVSQPQEHEHGRAGPASCLVCSSIREREIAPPLPYVLATGTRWESWLQLGKEQESWSCPSPAAPLRTDSEQHSSADHNGRDLGELALSARELVLSAVHHAITWVKKRWPPSLFPLANNGRQESWPCPSPAVALERADPAPHLGNIVELILMARV